MPRLKKGDRIIYPILPQWGSKEEIMKEMKKVAKRFKHPLEELRYSREIFYFKARGIKEEGWVDNVDIIYTKK